VNPVCPYCRTEVDAADGGRVDCSECHTPHHQDCFTENGGCTVFGCAQAPVDEPKISLTAPEVAAAQATVAERPALSAAAAASPNLNLQGASYVLFPAQGTGTANSVSLPGAGIAAGVMTPTLPQRENGRDTTAVPPPPPLHGFGSVPPPPLPAGHAAQSPGSGMTDYSRLSPAEIYAGVESHRSRVVYVLLGLFMGCFGAHNFYARYFRRGAAQAAITVFWWVLASQGYGALITWIWAILEVCLIAKDADGVQFS
jgi:TM2 domain-containing membrane protein YozV